MRFLHRSIVALALVAGLAVSTGCAAEYDHTDITTFKPGLFQGHVDRDSIVLTNGLITTAHLVSYNDDKTPMGMSIRATDPTVVEVSNMISDHDWAFIGLKEGSCDVQVLADDKVVLVIPAQVVAQPATP